MAIPSAKPSKALFLILLLAGRELVQCERITTHTRRVGYCGGVTCRDVNGQCPVGEGCCVYAWKDRIMPGYSKSCTETSAEVLAYGMILHSKKLFLHVHDFGVNGGLLNFWAKGMFEHLGAFTEVLSAAKTYNFGGPTQVAELFWRGTLYDFQLGLTQMAPQLELDPNSAVFSFGPVDFGDAVSMSSKNGAMWMFSSIISGMNKEKAPDRLKPEVAQVWEALESYNPSSTSSAKTVAGAAIGAGLDGFPADECMDIMAKKTKGDVLQAEAQNQGYGSAGLLEEFAVRHRAALLDISGDSHRDIISSYLDHKSSLLQLSSDALAQAQLIIFEVILTIASVVLLIVVIYYTVKSNQETTWDEKKWATAEMWKDFKAMLSGDRTSRVVYARF